MKLSLFIILLFAVIIGLCSCVPPGSKKQKCEGGSISFLNTEDVQHSDEERTASGKLRHPNVIRSALRQPGAPKNTQRRVSFKKKADICKKSSLNDEPGIFWMSYKNFAPILFNKCDLFPEGSPESEFIALVQDCIERMYGMFDLLYRSAAKFSSYDSYLCQIEIGSITFPNSTKFTEVKNIKEYFEETYIGFLDNLLPSYELNEYLLGLVQTMNKNTKIDPRYVGKLMQLDEKIYPIWDAFWEIFNGFTLDEYMKGLSEIRKTINHLEFEKIDLQEADRRLSKSLLKLYANAPQINEALTAAWDIDFETMAKATKAFYSYVCRALNYSGASSSK